MTTFDDTDMIEEAARQEAAEYPVGRFVTKRTHPNMAEALAPSPRDRQRSRIARKRLHGRKNTGKDGGA